MDAETRRIANETKAGARRYAGSDDKQRFREACRAAFDRRGAVNRLGVFKAVALGYAEYMDEENDTEGARAIRREMRALEALSLGSIWDLADLPRPAVARALDVSWIVASEAKRAGLT